MWRPRQPFFHIEKFTGIDHLWVRDMVCLQVKIDTPLKSHQKFIHWILYDTTHPIYCSLTEIYPFMKSISVIHRLSFSCQGVTVGGLLILLTLDVTAQTVNICDRTGQVESVILRILSHDNCATVTSAQLSSITILGLNDTFLSLHEDDLDGLTGLGAVYIRGNRSLAFLPEGLFGDQSSLREMSLAHNSLSSLPKGLFNGLSSLQVLDLSHNSFNSLHKDLFDGLSSLTNLNLFNNYLTTLPVDLFAGLTSLQSLDLDGNSISNLSPNHFAGLSALEVLKLDRNYSFSSLGQDLFVNLSSLRSLHLSNNSLSNLHEDVFNGLPSLGILNLSTNSLSNLHKNLFAGLSSLHALNLSNNSLSSLDEDLFANLSTLQTLSLGGNPLGSLDADIFANLSSLVMLYLSANSLSNLPDDLFEGLSTLRRVYLFSNSLTSLSEDLLADLTELRTLDLSYNSLTTLPANIFDGIESGLVVGLSRNPIECLPQKILDLEAAGTIRIIFREEIQPCVDPTPLATLELTPKTIMEGEFTTVTASLSAASTATTLIEVSVVPEAPATTADYTLSGNTLTIAAGETESTGEVRITAADDQVDGLDKMITVSGVVTNAQGVLDPEDVILTILDNDTATSVTLSVSPSEVREQEGSQTITVRATVDVARDADTQVTVSVEDGTATVGTDYELVSPVEIKILAKERSSSATFPFTPIPDEFFETEETVFVTGTTSVEGLEVSPATLTLIDPIPEVVLELIPEAIPEAEGEATLTARLTPPSTAETVITISAEATFSATDSDFVLSSNPILTIPAGATTSSEQVTITAVDNLVDGPDKTVILSGHASNLFGVTGPEDRTLTILGDDDPITLAVQTWTVSEEVGIARLPIEVSPAAPFDLNVHVQTTGLTATEEMDYTLLQNLLPIPEGSTTAFIEVQITDDPLFEGEETFQIQLIETEGVVLNPGEATVTIKDNDLYELQVENTSVLESAGEMTFMVTLNPPNPVQTVRVAFETANETAMEPMDYLRQSGMLVFPPDTPRREVSVPIMDDTQEELEETFLLRLSQPEYAVLSTVEARGTIRDDDALPVMEIEASVTVREEAGQAQFAVTLSRVLSGRDPQVEFSVLDETANAPLDYQVLTPSPLRFLSGETTKSIVVQIMDDEIHEEEETFRIQLRDPQNGVLGQSEAQGIILDNEDPVTVSIRDAEVTESEAAAVFRVELSGLDSKPRTFGFTTEDASALSRQDYEAAAGEVTFAPEEVLKDIRVSIINDLETEPTESFRVRLSGNGISDGDAQGTIQDDDAPLTVSIYDESASEGDGSLLLPVRLNRASSELVTVRYTSSDETAEEGSDYVSSQGIVIFQRGSTEGKIRIQILEDSEVESEETFQVTLSNARHATIAQETGTGTILDNDGSPTVAVQNVMVSTRTAIFEVHLSKPSPLPVLVSYATEDGSALAGEDYEPLAGQVAFEPGEVSKTIEVKLLSSERIREAKTFALALLSAMNAQVEQARTEAVVEEESEEIIQNAYVSRVLRTWASQVVDAFSRRMEGMAQCSIPDLSWLRYGTARRSLGDIFRGCGAAYTQGGWSVWGQGAFTRMNGRDGALSLRSNVTTMLLGADYVWRQGWMAGLLAAQSWDQGTYETPTRSGSASSRLTGFYPYVSYQTGAGMRAWMLLGLGRGETEVETLESELDAALVALGLTGTLTGGSTGRLGYEVDAFWATAEMEIGSDLGVRRVRAGVEGSLQMGAGMQPYMEAALRQDGGDAETGLGMELGGGVRWSTSQLRAEVGGRTLVLHTDEGLREWGLTGSVEYGSPDGLGPSMRVRPLWGNVYGGDLWREAPLHSMGVGSTDQRVEMELGYGMPIRKSLGRSIVGMTLDPSGRAYRVGYNLRMNQGLQVSIATTARTMEANRTPSSYGLGGRVHLKW